MADLVSKSSLNVAAQPDLDEILVPVREGLKLVDQEIAEIAQVEFPILGSLLEYVLSSKGKRIRPAVVLLAGGFGTNPTERLFKLGAAIELMHTATLIHDDFVDDSKVRRGMSSLHSLVPTRAAVLVGDYVFATAAELCTRTHSHRAMRSFGQTLMAICDGELRQMYSRAEPDFSRETYFKKIGSKTASLLSTAAETGAIVSEADEYTVAKLRECGYNLGLAFQIVDDVLDFTGDENDMGKPVGSDLLQGNITLPAILLAEADVGVELLNGVIERPESREELAPELVRLVRESSAVVEANGQAEHFSRRAQEALSNLPDNHYKESLLHLSEYVLRRRH